MRSTRLPLLSVALLLITTACSSGPAPKPQSDPGSPIILTMRTEPGTIELNRDLQPIRVPKVQADIQDLHSEVTEVMLQFDNVPLTVPMNKVSGNTWEVQLDSHALEMMAVSGETTKYGAQIMAKNADGKKALSDQPVIVSVKAPSLAKSSNT
ncbi:MAG: hypothetical protein ACJ763_03575 [Bdellovibrionia bacterium]